MYYHGNSHDVNTQLFDTDYAHSWAYIKTNIDAINSNVHKSEHNLDTSGWNQQVFFQRNRAAGTQN